jgi:hypothetical protein
MYILTLISYFWPEIMVVVHFPFLIIWPSFLQNYTVAKLADFEMQQTKCHQ